MNGIPSGPQSPLRKVTGHDRRCKDDFSLSDTAPVVGLCSFRACTHKIAIGESDLINVRFGPLCGLTSDISRGPRSANRRPERVQRSALFDHLVGAGEEHRRNFEAECFRGLEVDYRLVLCGRLYQQIGCQFPVENAAYVLSRASKGSADGGP